MPYADPDVRRAKHREYMRERYRHDSEHRERHKDHVRHSRQKRRLRIGKLIAAARSGGCIRCGKRDPKELHFHHTGEKSFTIAEWSRLGKSEAQVLAEIAKCEVLCRGCHIDEHRPPLSHGTLSGYARGCRCDSCRSARSDYARAYYARTKTAR